MSKNMSSRWRAPKRRPERPQAELRGRLKLTPKLFARYSGMVDPRDPEVYAITDSEGEEFARIRRSTRKGRYIWRLRAPCSDRKAIYDSPEEAMAAFQQLGAQQSMAAFIGR